MTDSSIASSSRVSSALHTLRTSGRVTLPGRIGDPHLRMRRRLTTVAIVVAIICAAGLIVLLMGILLRAALLIGIGAPFVFIGLVFTVVTVVVSSNLRRWLRVETAPVTIDAQGIRLRGIGPVPWADVYPPAFIKITTRGDVNGVCGVMALTPQGYARVNSFPLPQSYLIGPKPYFRIDVPYLLLPGIAGVTEADTVYLFGVAHEMFSRGLEPRSFPHS